MLDFSIPNTSPSQNECCCCSLHYNFFPFGYVKVKYYKQKSDVRWNNQFETLTVSLVTDTVWPVERFQHFLFSSLSRKHNLPSKWKLRIAYITSRLNLPRTNINIFELYMTNQNACLTRKAAASKLTPLTQSWTHSCCHWFNAPALFCYLLCCDQEKQIELPNIHIYQLISIQNISRIYSIIAGRLSNKILGHYYCVFGRLITIKCFNNCFKGF